MRDGVGGVILAFFFLGVALTFWVMIFAFGTTMKGYVTAYEDYRKGRLEQVMRNEYPAVWVRLNKERLILKDR
jgi:hypothetical protein